MPDAVIRVRGLGKRYLIGHQSEHERYSSLRDAIARKARNLARSVGDMASGKAFPGGGPMEVFWALKDVDFEIGRGEIAGIVGRNGAGKSTLLKILSRITEPSTGRVELRGRVASLLEVGTGFHPELTGRENVFLNGAILGMSQAEVRRKFDEIVAFAEVEKFLDTPVKRYSSGMYVRLAFAVAAHLEPEILLVDEVLAVGDAEFQKKCIGKMSNVAKSGRTVLFVSHNAQAVSALCDRVIWLDKQRVAMDGTPREVFEKYLNFATSDISASIAALPQDPLFRLLDVKITQGGRSTGDIAHAQLPLEVEISYEVRQPTLGLRVLFQLCDELDNVIVQGFHDENDRELVAAQPGAYRSVCVIPANLLGPVNYHIRVQAGIHHGRPVMPLEGVVLSFKGMRPHQGPAEYAGLPFPAKLAPPLLWRTTTT